MSYRSERYLGDAISVSITTVRPPDQAAIRQVSRLLGELQHLVGSDQVPSVLLPALRRLRTQIDWTEQVRRIRSVQRTTNAPGAAGATRDHVIHDIRGGALQVLTFQLPCVDLGLAERRDVAQIFYLARDHRKIMRNAVPDLDPEQSVRDRSTRLHHVALLIAKWQHAFLHIAEQKPVQVQVRTSFTGSVATRCRECSALDRVRYNLLNTALRNTNNGQVTLVILPVPAHQPDNLRFGVANRVSPAQQQVLQTHDGGHLHRLFAGGFTTGGTGQGNADLC
ncbi:MAG: hypothetical protein ACLFVO_18585 [Chloroflexaceae bacterium]